MSSELLRCGRRNCVLRAGCKGEVSLIRLYYKAVYHPIKWGVTFFIRVFN
jgi:hypothetical protein